MKASSGHMICLGYQARTEKGQETIQGVCGDTALSRMPTQNIMQHQTALAFADIATAS